MGKDNETGHHKKIKITETSLDTQRRMTDGTKRVAVPITEIWKQGGQITDKANLARTHNVHGHQQ